MSEQPFFEKPSKSARHGPCTLEAHDQLSREGFRDLLVWQRAMNLVLDVYRITDAYPRYEMFNLTTHTRKSAISIPSNVAEGANRRALAPYVNHVNIAMGSEGELFTQLEVGRRLGYVSDKDLQKPFRELNEIGRMLNGLSTSLELAIERRRRSIRNTGKPRPPATAYCLLPTDY